MDHDARAEDYSEERERDGDEARTLDVLELDAAVVKRADVILQAKLHETAVRLCASDGLTGGEV